MRREIFERGDMLNKDTVEFTARYIRDLATLQGTTIKAIASGCIAVFTHTFQAFSELMWVVVFMVLVDFVLGILRAIRDPGTKLKWAEALNSVVKIFVVMAGAVGVHLMAEILQHTSGVDTHRIFEILFLASVGVGEAVSILSHLAFHFPAFEKASEKIKRYLEKGVDDGTQGQ